MHGGVLDGAADFTRADCLTRGIGWVIVRMDRFRESFLVIQTFLGLAFVLIATLALAQSLPNGSRPSSPQMQAGAEINQRLEQETKSLARATIQSRNIESRIGPDDLLNISIFEAPEMNCTVRVSAGGDISLQLLGAVHAADLTPGQLESVLQGLLRGAYM